MKIAFAIEKKTKAIRWIYMHSSSFYVSYSYHLHSHASRSDIHAIQIRVHVIIFCCGIFMNILLFVSLENFNTNILICAIWRGASCKTRR